MGGVYFAYMGRRNPLTDCARFFFLVKDIHDVITHAKFGDDRLRGLGVVAGQISAFPIDSAGRPYNTLTLLCERVIVMEAISREFRVASISPLVWTSRTFRDIFGTSFDYDLDLLAHVYRCKNGRQNSLW